MNRHEARGLAIFFGPIVLVMAILLLLTQPAGCATFQADTKVVASDAEKVLVDVGVRGTPLVEPGLAEAVTAVWTSYGRTDPPPRVLIVSGADLSCADPNGNPGFPVLMLTGPACREGYTLLPWEVSIAYRGQAWATSALAHELMHAVLIRSLQGNPLGDPDHKTAGFQLGGLVDQANAALAAKGI